MRGGHAKKGLESVLAISEDDNNSKNLNRRKKKIQLKEGERDISSSSDHLYLTDEDDSVENSKIFGFLKEFENRPSRTSETPSESDHHLNSQKVIPQRPQLN